MDFELTAEQVAVRDATRSVLRAYPDAARTHVEGGHGYDSALWNEGVEMGWTALAVPEAAGGLGQGVADLALVAVEHGRSVTASPLMPTAVVIDALLTSPSAADRASLVEDLISGKSTAAWAFAEPGRTPSIGTLRGAATAEESGYRLSADKAFVQDAATADVLLVDVVLDGQPARFLVPRDESGVKIRRIESLDLTRDHHDVSLSDVLVDSSALLATGEAAIESISRSDRLMTILTCAELVGVGEHLLETSVEYAKTRQQFGVPIGSHQAVKHKCADMRMWVQASRAATLHAAMVFDAVVNDTDTAAPDGSADPDHAVSVAKAFTSDAISRTAGEALQVHGGIGFTWEHDLHLYIRRARTNAALCGDVRFHRERLCTLLEERRRRSA